MNGITLGFAMTGSFCTLSRALEQMQKLKEKGYSILPVFSENTAKTDTRFGKAEDFIRQAEMIAERKAICDIVSAEPIGPKKMTDLMIVAPCTGNTLGKMALGITDTTVTMAVKSHLRQGKPVLVAVSTNDALSASAQNIGRLFNVKNMFFVPFTQDAPETKNNSLVADFSLIPQAVEAALSGKQLQPLLLSAKY